MVLGVIFILTGICLLIALMFNMAIFALPLFSGFAVGRFAYDTGAGWLGAILIGLVAAVLTLGVGQLILAVTKSSLLRLAIAAAFAAPAAFAGYHVLLGLSRIGGAHGVWQPVFAGVGAVIIAGAALTRLATPMIPLHESPRAA